MANSLKDIKDEKLREAVRKELIRQEKRRRLLQSICILVAIGCLGYFGFYAYMHHRTRESAKNWAQIKEEALKKPNTSKKNKDTTQEVVVHKTEGRVVPDVLPEYKTLLQKNKSLIGWVKIADTNIDYPVMQAGDNEYYLTHNFEQNYDKNGCIFLDSNCDVVDRSTNLIVYGHHMKSGAMFGNLDAYADPNYYATHSTFEFDTIYEKGTYQMVYVFRSQVFKESEVRFKYYQFIDANSEEEFNSNMREMENLSLYNTGVTPVYGNQLVTLSTCDHSEERNGRFVVVGVKLE